MHGAALALGRLQRRGHRITCGLVYQRANQRARGLRVTNRQTSIGGLQAFHQIRADGVMHDQAAQRGAALTGGAHGREHNRPHRHFQIRRGGHDHRVVAAQFQNALAEPLCHHRCHRTAHAGRPRGRNHRHGGAGDQRLAQFRIANQGLQQALGRVLAKAFHRAFKDLSAGQRRQRCFLRRFPDHRIAADNRQCRVPRPDRNREVERRDHPHRPRGMPCFAHAVAGPFRGNRQTIKLA